jgi:hypothetical protein
VELAFPVGSRSSFAKDPVFEFLQIPTMIVGLSSVVFSHLFLEYEFAFSSLKGRSPLRIFFFSVCALGFELGFCCGNLAGKLRLEYSLRSFCACVGSRHLSVCPRICFRDFRFGYGCGNLSGALSLHSLNVCGCDFVGRVDAYISSIVHKCSVLRNVHVLMIRKVNLAIITVLLVVLVSS